ncbi:hypothetical protein E1B28_004804 [Marasmius oreades]|uniref:DUF7330 domain-containing protein n=1 Tax=Marasmius oreades TaxID=181124 RepID=A0A9P7UZK1_9AGAR|nr:uncharacterized protein E1B28_004804 [Marasmius oreades]KAG7097460.1 hypothetical protein E1B28_004804 [Marasmius oreades]
MTGISLSRVGDPPYKSADITAPHSSTDDPEPGLKVSSNYTRIVREKGPIKEIFVIDHRIQLHERLLPPLNEAERSAEGGRSNLFVKTKSGKVDVDIFIATDSPSPKPNRKHRTSSFATVTKKVNLVVESERGV